jgi:hypothetical protein
MQAIKIYARDEQGLITYLGPSAGWDSLEDLLRYYVPAHADDVGEREELLGWPHDAVIWYGSLGVAA